MVAYHVSLVATQHDSDQSTGFGGTKNTFVANFKRSSYCCVGGKGYKEVEYAAKVFFGCFVHPNALVSRKDLCLVRRTKHPKNTFAAYFSNL